MNVITNLVKPIAASVDLDGDAIDLSDAAQVDIEEQYSKPAALRYSRTGGQPVFNGIYATLRTLLGADDPRRASMEAMVGEYCRWSFSYADQRFNGSSRMYLDGDGFLFEHDPKVDHQLLQIIKK